MLKFDFSDPTRWDFVATCVLHSPKDEDHADYVGQLMDDVLALNNADSAADHWNFKIAAEHATPGSRFAERRTCDHCGAHFLYGAAYLNLDSGDYAVVGHTCATKKLNLTADGYALKRAKALVKRARSRARADRWESALAPNRREALNHDHYISADMRSRFRKWGSLSVKQWALAKKIRREALEREAERAAEPTPVAIPDSLTDGRHEFAGEIVGIRWDDTPYGSVKKMLFRDGRGFKLWSTVPAAIGDATKGARIRFMAAVDRSEDDACFGFAKRPTKAAVVQGA